MKKPVNIKLFRKAFPEFNNWSDDEIISYVYTMRLERNTTNEIVNYMVNSYNRN